MKPTLSATMTVYLSSVETIKNLGTVSDNKFIPFNYKIGQRSQDLEPLFFENGLLYSSKATLIQNHIVICENFLPFEVEHIFANIDIDTQNDLDFAQIILNNHY